MARERETRRPGHRVTGSAPGGSPVAVDVAGAEREAAVDQHRVDHGALLAVRQQVPQVGQVAETGADTVPRAVLVHHKHLAGTQPALSREHRVTDTQLQIYSQLSGGYGETS